MKLTDGWRLCGIKILDEKTKRLPLYFHSIGHYPGQKHVFRPEGLGQYQICICTEGCGVFNTDGVEYDIKKGDIFYLAPEVGHEYYPRDEKWTLIWVVFNGSDPESVLSYFDFEGSFVRRAGECLNKLVEICERLYATYNETESYRFSLTRDLMEIIDKVSECERVEKKEGTGEKSGSFSPVIDYIKKHYMEMITLDDIAKESELSKSHFARMFKGEYGVTPMVYLNRYRISVAKFLLATTMESIEVIAGKTGFADTSYFCAVFKKYENSSPAQYRQRHKKR